MARLIVKSPYIKCGGGQGADGYMRYIATRERVEIIPDDRPPTRKQEQLITKLTKDFPDVKELLEYEDYTAHPTKAHASSLITLALEEHWKQVQQTDGYMKYIATRPRAERLGDHGLVGDTDHVDLDAAMSELEHYTGNVWTHIISLHREDAERLGYNNAQAWRALLRAHRNDIAAAMHIPPQDFRWYAAFHNEGHHPHIHMMAWSVKPGQAHLDRDGIRSIRSQLTNEIFQQELLHVYEQKIRLPLPAELQGKAGYAVYRVHNNQAEAMKANPGSGEEGFKVEGSYITIYAQKFSTYAIGYTESSGNNNNNNQSSGGGGSSTPTYPPSIEEPEHGSVTVSPKNPEKGDQVTITPTPDEEYTVDTVIVTDPNGKPVAVTPNDDGTYTFVQPTGKVTITVTFRKLTSVSDCPRDKSCPMAPFTDADRNAWYHDGIHYCVEHGLMSGYGNGIFGPNKSLSRGMLVQILYNLEDRPATSDAEMFKDVPDSAWCFDAVNWAASVGIVGGYGNGMYRPDDSITREQLAAMLYRYAQYKEYDVSVGEGTNLLSYTDASRISEYAIPAMQWACGTGIIAGVTSSTLVPKGTATRAQVATMLMRFADKVAQ